MQDVLQRLLVVADREEGSGLVGAGAVLRCARHDGDGAIAKSDDFALPLRLERRRAYDQDLLDPDFSSEELGDADALNGLPRPISSAKIARPAPAANAMPSSW